MTAVNVAKLKYRAKNGIVRVLGPLGLYAALRRKTLHQPRLLMYHRFGDRDSWNRVSADTFRYQVRYLKKHFDIVTMRELGGRLASGQIRPGQAVITVDDGYADFYDIAFPVLKQENVPATFYVTTRFIDRVIWLWPDKLEYLLAHSSLTENEAHQEWVRQVDKLLDFTPPVREQMLANLMSQYAVEVPKAPTERYRACSWEQIEEMSSCGIEIGAHTENHPRLTNLDDASLAAEVEISKRKIDVATGLETVSFCYPNGAPEDYDDRVEGAVRVAGFSTAVTAHHDGTRGDQYSLRRLGIGSDHYSFHKLVAGARFL